MGNFLKNICKLSWNCSCTQVPRRGNNNSQIPTKSVIIFIFSNINKQDQYPHVFFYIVNQKVSYKMIKTCLNDDRVSFSQQQMMNY